MDMNVRCRSGKHLILKPSDRRSNGACVYCSRDNEARYRARRNEKLARLEELELQLT